MPQKSFQWYVENGCKLQHPDIGTFMLVFKESNGNPCAECFDKRSCDAWLLINHPGSKSLSGKIETNAQAADRLGISKRQASKLRKEGKL